MNKTKAVEDVFAVACGRLSWGDRTSQHALLIQSQTMNRVRLTPLLRTAAPFTFLLGLPGLPALQGQSAPQPVDEDIVVLEKFVADDTAEDPAFVLPNQPVQGVVGFSKRLVETPRSATIVSAEMISSMSLSEVSDLSRIAPSTNTTTRWGVQGNIDIRNMTADTYFRGMKRIEPQGNSRTVLGANDQIEIIRGPAPAYFGSGKIGGYTNLTPKSGRSAQGKYLEKDTGFVQAIGGEYGKREVSFGYGGPLKSRGNGLRGGYYIYALLEDSDSYYSNVPVEQRVLQAAISQELTRNWRLEAGINFQETHSAGGFLNRVTQELVDDGVYWSGRALVNLDADASGKISEQEMVLGSPVGGVFGPAGSNNRALNTRFYGSNAAGGSRFTQALAGAIPTLADTNANSALAALRASNPDFVALMEADPARYGNNLKLLNVLQQGFVFDPDSMAATEANFRHVALEKELLAKLGLVYIDLVNDYGDTKIKNQILFDSQDQFKDSELPFYQKQDIWVIEDKFTVEYPIPSSRLPEWLQINTITSANFRYTNARRNANSGDYDDRPNLALPQNVRTPWDTFVSPRENTDYFNGGAPFSSMIKTTYAESGIGTMLDITLRERFSLMLGGRVDYIQADTTVPPGLYRMGTNGLFTSEADAAAASGEGDDIGKSYTISLSYHSPYGIHPYVTIGEQTALSDGADLTLPGNLAAAGPYDPASLKEVGMKGSHFRDKFYWAVSAYEMERSTVTTDLTGNPLVGGLSNLKGRGVEIEARWVPSKNFYVSVFSVFSKTEFVDTAQWARVHGEPLGFSDVIDPVTGRVIYPAQAFTWGGQASVLIDADEKVEQNGYPNTTHGVAFEYTFPNGIGFGGSGNYISEVQSGRYISVILPEAYTVNAFVQYRSGGWRFKLDVMNLTDEQVFRGRNGGGAGDVLISAMQPRRFQFTVAKMF